MLAIFFVCFCVDCQEAQGCGKADRTALIAGSFASKYHYPFVWVGLQLFVIDCFKFHLSRAICV